MKKIFALVLLAVTLPVMAQHHHHGHWRPAHGGGWNWVVPAIIGGAIVYEVTRPPVVIQQPQPVIVQQNRVVNDSNCSPWTETQNPDGTITRTRTCNQ